MAEWIKQTPNGIKKMRRQRNQPRNGWQRGATASDEGAKA
jgi:hypothetical protein